MRKTPTLSPQFRKMLIPMCAATVLAACGGGGNDDPPPPPANRAPVITSTALTTTEDLGLSAQIVATDADGNALTFTRVNDVQHGTLTLSAAGIVAYTPTANYAGTDTFSVRVSDGAGGETTGTVTITVTAINDPPTIATNTFNAIEDTALDGNFLPSDIDSTTVTVTRTSDPQHGQLTLTAAGLFHYVPAANYFGTDVFGVSVSDGDGGTTPVNVNLIVAPQNDTPVLVSSALSVNEDNTLSAQLIADDIESQVVTFALDASTQHGQIAVSPGGLLTYTPNANYYGTDTLSVQISDNPQQVTTWNITITVNSVNDLPVAVDDEFRIADGAPRTLAVAANDSDVEGALTVSVLQQPTGGTVSVGAGNVLTFTPANEFTGPITFTYRLTDSDGGHDDATVHALIGNFQGLIYLADDLTPGRQEIYLFDGLHSTRIVQSPMNSFESITRFTVSDDGSKLLYVIAGPLVDEFYFKPVNAAGNGTKIWANTPGGPPNINSGTRLVLNPPGSHALIEDRYSPNAKNIYVVETSTGNSTLVGADVPQFVRAPIILFNPGNVGQIVLQGQVGGTVPTNGQEFYTAFVTSVNRANQLTQIGANYPQLGGAGSGFGFWFSTDGIYIYHTEYLPNAVPFTKTLLVHDILPRQESVVYRRPMGNEHGLTTLPATNADGTRIVFGFTEPNPANGDGPGAFHVSQPATPATAVPLSSPFARAGRIQFTSDGRTVILPAWQAANGEMELFASNTSNPALPPVRIGKQLDAGETFARSYVARRAQRLIVGYRTAPSEEVRLYNIPVDSTGNESPFTTTLPYFGAPGEDIDDNAQFLAYAPVEGSRRMLRIMSTRALDYSLPVMGSGSSQGVIQFRWLPRL